MAVDEPDQKGEGFKVMVTRADRLTRDLQFGHAAFHVRSAEVEVSAIDGSTRLKPRV